MLTVRELLGDLGDVAILAGDDALDAPMRSVHISELTDPTRWLSGGELLLTTGFQLTDPATQHRFVERLADHGLAGLGFGVGFAHDRVPGALVVAARERGFPLIEIPYELPFIAITEQAFTRLVDEEYALLRRRVADSTERRLAGDVLAGIESGALHGTELARRLEPFRLGSEVTALVVEPALDAALADALDAEALPALVATQDERAVAIVPGMPGDELVEIAGRVRARLAAETGTRVSAGAGRAVPAGEARRALHEARCALEARSMADANGGGVGTWHDLGSFQLLLSLQDHEALGLYCDTLLGPIEAGEWRYGGELMRSLEAFIENNGQWERAAQQLYCHRHTLRYRIRRIEELTGRDLGSARDRIEFWLALRGKEIASR